MAGCGHTAPFQVVARGGGELAEAVPLRRRLHEGRLQGRDCKGRAGGSGRRRRRQQGGSSIALKKGPKKAQKAICFNHYMNFFFATVLSDIGHFFAKDVLFLIQ